MSDYTRPERSAELRLGRRLLAQVLSDPCGHCLNRQMVFGKAICSGTAGRTWWQCRDGKTEPTFKLDDATIEGSQ